MGPLEKCQRGDDPEDSRPLRRRRFHCCTAAALHHFKAIINTESPLVKTSRRLLQGAPPYLLRKNLEQHLQSSSRDGVARLAFYFPGSIHKSVQQEVEITVLGIHLSRDVPHSRASCRLTVSGGDGVTPDGPGSDGFPLRRSAPGGRLLAVEAVKGVAVISHRGRRNTLPRLASQTADHRRSW